MYDHCLRALAYSAKLGVGRHGLPHIGAGDWNDGFSKVGLAGRGESVWLGWFVHAACSGFAGVCDRLGRSEDADALRARAAGLEPALEASWDGAWYRRAYYDDGTPMGSANDEACRIDSIAQSWAVLSGVAPGERGRQAMQEVQRQLFMPEEQLVRLFVPPFDRGASDPGYIKAYPPGVRENGGQYTHAAAWAALAFLRLGEPDTAYAALQMLLPVAHGGDAEGMRVYAVEPYVIAADIYTEEPHVGRGGWTWYTGSAAWVYRVAVEGILGVRRLDGRIALEPAIPSGWPGYELVVRDGGTTHHVVVKNGGSGARIAEFIVDGVSCPLPALLPVADGKTHDVLLRLS